MMMRFCVRQKSGCTCLCNIGGISSECGSGCVGLCHVPAVCFMNMMSMI